MHVLAWQVSQIDQENARQRELEVKFRQAQEERRAAEELVRKQREENERLLVSTAVYCKLSCGCCCAMIALCLLAWPEPPVHDT